MNVIEIKDLNKFFGTGENKVHILKNIQLNIAQGDFVAIMGQSGSGKSTLMNILGCLDTPSSGTYAINGVETQNLTNDQLADLRSRKFGFIFQRYNLLSTLPAIDNVALPAVYSGMDSEARLKRAGELLANLGLEDKKHRLPNELSGGQQQRVSIARALMNGGEVILADEPTGALDSKSGEVVMDIIMELNRKGHTIIVVTHDPNIAAYANRIVEIKDGEILSDSRSKPEPAPAKADKIKQAKVNPFLYHKNQLIESLKMSVQAILAHKMRSLLTMLGIIIGIASVVSVVALGRGSQEKIMQDINAIGTNTVNIYPGAYFGDKRSGKVKTLTVSDSIELAKQSYIDSSTPVTSSSGVLVYGNVSANAQVTGVGKQYFDVKGLKIASGIFFTEKDVRENASVVVIDQNTRKELFPNGQDPIGATIIFDRVPLRIIGVTEPQDSFGANENLNLWAPYTTVMYKISGDSDIKSIIVKISDKVNSQVAELSLTHLIEVKHGKRDFFTTNTDSVKKTIENATNTMTALISCIALISLIVGGIGVMNIMLVSVTERTREIGVRMAIGARQFNILQQFLIEAVLICIIGGIAGVALSYGVGLAFSAVVSAFALSYSLASVVLALTCSSLIGIVFGYIPARNASKLNPIDALSRD